MAEAEESRRRYESYKHSLFGSNAPVLRPRSPHGTFVNGRYIPARSSQNDVAETATLSEAQRSANLSAAVLAHAEESRI